MQSFETIGAAGVLVHHANSALDFAVFEISSEIGQRTVYKTDTMDWNLKSS